MHLYTDMHMHIAWCPNNTIARLCNSVKYNQITLIYLIMNKLKCSNCTRKSFESCFQPSPMWPVLLLEGQLRLSPCSRCSKSIESLIMNIISATLFSYLLVLLTIDTYSFLWVIYKVILVSSPNFITIML